jgi:hypothetical protein
MKYIKQVLYVLVISCTVGFTTGVAFGEETKAPTVRETFENLGKWVQDIPNKPAKVGTWATNEWTEIKEYQAKGWADGKEQNAKNFEKVKGFFSSLIAKNENTSN